MYLLLLTETDNLFSKCDLWSKGNLKKATFSMKQANVFSLIGLKSLSLGLRPSNINFWDHLEFIAIIR